MAEIDTIVEEINKAVINGVNKICYHLKISQLNNELERCRSEMEGYKKELAVVKSLYQNESKEKENISLQIQEATVKPVEFTPLFKVNVGDTVVSAFTEEEEGAKE